MLIDLHCHTKKTKKGDGIGRNVTPELFRTKIELVDVKIVAVTNHNAFDFGQYTELKEAVSDICQVWPGVEIDVKGTLEKEKFHLIVVCNPEDALDFDSTVSELFNGCDINSCVHSLQDVCKKFKKLDAIYIPHFHNKRPAISEVDRQKLISIIGDESRVFIEPRDHRTLGVLANNRFNVLLGSDVKDWNEYEKCTFSELRLPIRSFSELLLLAKRDSSVVKTLLNNKQPSVMIGKPHKSVELHLSIYPDVNIIFGPKGTGKTKILESLYEAMLQEGRVCNKYIASERGEDFSALTSVKGLEVDFDRYQIYTCEKEFEIIRNWNDTNPGAFSNYLSWIETRGNSNNKARMRITEAVHDVFTKDDSYDTHKTDLMHFQKAWDELLAIDFHEYLSDEDGDRLGGLLSTLRGIIRKERVDDLVEENASKLTNFTIDTIKKLADRNSDTVSRPSTAGLVSFAEKRLELIRAVQRILSELNREEINEKRQIGTLEDKGTIYVNTKHRMLCSSSKTAEFGGYGIRVLRDIVNLLHELAGDWLVEDIATKVDKLNELCEDDNITSIRPFLGKSRQIVTENGEEYLPSNGEKGILLLQQALRDDADAYFLDEPELGMGNSYIDTDIRPLISNLAKQRKYVVVATHNANIAVRTLPYMSIFRTYENGVYKTYTGNPFDDRLVNLENAGDVRSWTEESMHSLEGSREAFYERKNIYESKDN